MKEIPLTQGKVALVDDADFESVSQFKWYANEKKPGRFYATRDIKQSDGTYKKQGLHQFLMPGIPMIDHKDGNSLNDCQDNLRPCTHSQNGGNRRRNRVGISEFKGVTLDSTRQKWVAEIVFKKKRYFLGKFSSPEYAAHAYDEAAKKLHGEFSRLNFPI